MKRILALLLFAASASAQHVWWTPAAPRIGDVLTIYYDTAPAGGIEPTTAALWLHWGVYDPIGDSWSTPPNNIWPAGSHIHTDNVAVQSPMAEGANDVWSVTVNFSGTTIENIAFVFTDGANTWDSNGGADWHLTFTQAGTVSWWTPEEPLPGDLITIFYDCVPGTLPNGAANVILHWGINESGHGNWHAAPQIMWPAGTVMDGVAARSPMVALGAGLFQISIQTIDTIYSLHYVTTDGTNWDNNGNANWDILLSEPPPVLETHVIFRYDPRSAFSSYFGPVTSVNLAGAFNGWSTTATPLTNIDQYGNRWGEVLMPVGRNEYKFVINGNNWQIDYDNPLNAPGGFNNSLAFFEADSLPQIYDIQPGENRVYSVGSNVVVTARVRPGDNGTPIQGTPVVTLNGANFGATWNSGTQLLTLDALPSDEGFVNIAISATDAAGRTGTRDIAYGFKTGGFLAADPLHDIEYNAYHPRSLDLLALGIRGFYGGDSLRFQAFVDHITDDDTMAVMITISATQGTFSEIPGFGGEVRVPDLSNGGVAIPLLNPTSPFFDAAVFNRIHPAGDLHADGPSVGRTHFEADEITTYIGTDLLELYLGSYQSAWHYSCFSFKPGNNNTGFCSEVEASIGGTDELYEPDVYDAVSFDASDISPKLFDNYGLTRRSTFDAPGRGVASIHPDSLGSGVRHLGPVCRILTRGAPTTDTTQTIRGRVTSQVALTSVWLRQNQLTHPVTMTGDSFAVPLNLVEGANLFTLWARDANGDTSNSPAMTFTLNVDHAPNIRITTNVGDASCFMDASATTDPENQQVSYQWSADPDNPAPVTLGGANTATASFIPPNAPGEYYFDLVATDPDNHQTHGRTFFTIRGQNWHGFSNDEAAYWAEHARIYEIFVRSYSPQGNLDGVTADMARIADLGVNAIWLMPIFEGPSDHGYEITDYYTVEQDYGSAEDLHELVEAAHAHGIRVMLDMVINHTGIGHPFMQDAERHGRYSHYWDWYDRDAQGNPTHYFDWTSLPNLNLNNPECAQYWIDMCKYWITEFDVDGYRCDVAWGPMQRSPQFWVNWRQQLKEIKPEICLLAETGANDFAHFTNMFDLCFDWNLHHEGTSSFANMFPQPPAFNPLTDLVTNYGFGWPAYKNPLRFVENHDEVRYPSENTFPQAKLVGSFSLSIPGAVMLYAGQEIGMTSQRGQITWGSDPNNMYPHFYRSMNARKRLAALRDGAFATTPNTISNFVYSFARFGPGMDPVVWAGNFSSEARFVQVTVNQQQLGIHPDSTYWVTELLGSTSFQVLGANLTTLSTSLSAFSANVWVISDSIITVDVPESRSSVPEKITLGDAYPNPFNPVTVLPLELSHAAKVSLKIYDVLGREAAVLADGLVFAGVHEFSWQAEDNATGIYFAVLHAGDVHQVKKLVLLK